MGWRTEAARAGGCSAVLMVSTKSVLDWTRLDGKLARW